MFLYKSFSKHCLSASAFPDALIENDVKANLSAWDGFETYHSCTSPALRLFLPHLSLKEAFEQKADRKCFYATLRGESRQQAT